MRASGLAGVLAASLVLAGCSNDAGGDPAPSLAPVTPSSSASPSATAGGGATDVPAEAQAATPEGAAAFARYFAEAVYQAYLDRNPQLVRDLSTPTCDVCSQYVASIEAIEAADADISDSYVVEIVDAAAPAEAGAEGRAQVTLYLKVGEFVVTDPSGKELVREPANSSLVQEIALVRQDGSWRVDAVTLT